MSKKKELRLALEKQISVTIQGLALQADSKKIKKSIRKASKILSRSLVTANGSGKSATTTKVAQESEHFSNEG